MILRSLLFFHLFFLNISADQGKFVLLLGPSGVGKSTIIEELIKIDNRFVYISPYTTRELRNGETNKIHASENEIREMEKKGELLTVNQLYGIYYATPKNDIDEALSQSKFPILDWPADKIDIMIKEYNSRLFIVYLEPDNIQELERRLRADQRDMDGKRLKSGKEELQRYWMGEYNTFLNLKIKNVTGKQKEVAEQIRGLL